MLLALSFVLALATPNPIGSGAPSPAPSATATCNPLDGSGCAGAGAGSRGPRATPSCDPLGGSGCSGAPTGGRTGKTPPATPDPLPLRFPLFRTWPVSDIGAPRVAVLTATQIAEAHRVAAALGADASLLMFALPDDPSGSGSTFVLYVRNPSQPIDAGVERGVIGSRCSLAYRVEPGNGVLVHLPRAPLGKCVETAADRAAGE